MKTQFDVVIVGSGPAGVHAAYPLIKAGCKVAIIDGGLDSKKQDKNLSSFLDVNFGQNSNAYDLIRKSSHVFNKTYQLLKIRSKIEIIQSLAKGGLAQQWHGICDFFSNDELKRIGLPTSEIQKEYKEIIKLIKLKLPSSKSVINLSSPKSILYQTPISTYHTSSAIEGLKQFINFKYIPNQLVYAVSDKKKYVEIQSFSIKRSLKSLTTAKFLILAAGAINSTRILLKSMGLFNYKTTFLTKANYLTACLYPKIFFGNNIFKKSNMSQPVISSLKVNRGLQTFFVQLYKFNPQALNKVIRLVPLPKFIASPILSIFAPMIIIADIRFPAFESRRKVCELINSNGEEVLEITFEESAKEIKDHKNELKRIKKQLHSLGLFPIKTIFGYTSSHYAGGIPQQKKSAKLSVDLNGKLNQGDRIYVADSSTWRALPAKAPTLTIMANASRVGKKVLKNFNNK